MRTYSQITEGENSDEVYSAMNKTDKNKEHACNFFYIVFDFWQSEFCM